MPHRSAGRWSISPRWAPADAGLTPGFESWLSHLKVAQGLGKKVLRLREATPSLGGPPGLDIVAHPSLLCVLSHVQLCATPQTAAHQAPPSMGFSRQEYWSGVPLPSPYISLNAFKNIFMAYECYQRAQGITGPHQVKCSCFKDEQPHM